MLNVRVNGETMEAPSGASIDALLERLGLAGQRQGVAVALNDELVPRARWAATHVNDGDRVEVVQAVQGGMDEESMRAATAESGEAAAQDHDTPLRIGPLTLSSRLILGTARYPSLAHVYAALEAARPGMVTVALRRVSLDRQGGESLWEGLDSRGYQVLPNTAGCFTARDAILTAQLGREALGTNIVKLEVIGDERTLYPDAVQLLEAARELIAQDFVVMPYCNDDPILCQRLEQLGCPCVMPLAAPIGSGLGIRNPHTLALIREAVSVPLLVDAGVGTASDVAVAMELGMDGVLMNTAIAGARNPVRMAHAVRHALEAGRLAYRAGRIPRKAYANASSPVDGLIETRIGKQFEQSFPSVPGRSK